MLIESAKTGPRQLSSVKDPEVPALLAGFTKQGRLQAKPKLFSLDYKSLLQQMREAAEMLGLPTSEVTTHSGRHGGALSLFLRGVSAQSIAQR